MSSMQELYNKSKLRQKAVPQSQDCDVLKSQVNELELKVSNLSQSVSDLALVCDKCQKSKISEQYNSFIEQYNASLKELQECIIDLSSRLTSAGF